MSKQTKSKGELIDCVVLSPVNHDGEGYAIGDSVSLTAKQAEELAAAEIVALPKAAKA
jgi:hypothetical protein